jgi:hypothetical protein
MPNLSTLLSNRVAPTRGTEELRLGSIFYFSQAATGVQICANYLCNYCWKSPGTGCAVIELWGPGGNTGHMCCCSGGSLPGNAGAYSRRTVPVTASSYVCGWVGCTTNPQSAPCWVGCSPCSVACLFNISASNCLMVSQGGAGGYTYCSTSTAPFCCFAGNSFCNTLCCACCGIICNVGGPNALSASGACACGGDLNVNGAISCIELLPGQCQYYPDGIRYTHALPAGLFSTLQSCIRYTGAPDLSGSGSNYITSNRWAAMMQLSNLAGSNVSPIMCWAGVTDCTCYQNTSSIPSFPPGVPGTGIFVCGGAMAAPARGGHGAVKITFYS